MKIPANQVKVGDVIRFRMSKYETARWLKVVAVTPGKFTYQFQLEHGCWVSHSIRNKSDWAEVGASHQIAASAEVRG